MKWFPPWPTVFPSTVCVASDTLPTAINLQRWSIQCEAKCLLCDSHCHTTAHVFKLLPYCFRPTAVHFQAQSGLFHFGSMLTDIFTDKPFVKVCADLPNFFANDTPQTTIPSDLLITSYRSDVVIHNTQCPSVTLLELTCPLDSVQHIQAIRDRKQDKVEYLHLLTELN